MFIKDTNNQRNILRKENVLVNNTMLGREIMFQKKVEEQGHYVYIKKSALVLFVEIRKQSVIILMMIQQIIIQRISKLPVGNVIWHWMDVWQDLLRWQKEIRGYLDGWLRLKVKSKINIAHEDIYILESMLMVRGYVEYV